MRPGLIFSRTLSSGLDPCGALSRANWISCCIIQHIPVRFCQVVQTDTRWNRTPSEPSEQLLNIMGRIAMQGLPKSHVGPKGYRHVNISAITYEPHCEPCHTTIANRWRHRIGNITNTNIFVFKQSGLKDVYNTLFFFFLPTNIHIPSLWQAVIFSLIVARCRDPQLDVCIQRQHSVLLSVKVLSPSGPSTAPQVEGINLENCEVTEQTKIYIPTFYGWEALLPEHPWLTHIIILR